MSPLVPEGLAALRYTLEFNARTDTFIVNHDQRLDAPCQNVTSGCSFRWESTLNLNDTSSSGTLTANSPIPDLLATIKYQEHQLELRNNSFGHMEDKQKLLKERLAELEEELEEKDSTIETLEKSKLQYRDWWLNEIEFTKYLLNGRSAGSQSWH
ncbi:hypothetical protein BKA70DRAFT_1219742 [Coprinopsis sp. MPI-PUGE-AT-0042]|nr:hypothetical protein BKA70DRAFT_1219742 [Coprinopsis sp. MPI-PUGE-AT-0042]